ncbi:MAG: ankyrin repeat domain-containing protein, partial [Spirochaetaceae bacterium]|nr:ankyrin repeat domain-containing protein [Spirochaetaceae bacterium]
MKNIFTIYIYITILILPSTIYSQSSVSRELNQLMNSTVYEIIVKKTTEDPITYEEELPLDLIPFHIRTDEYIPIGTAFAVGSNEFLTAAHVFSLSNRTLRPDVYIRDINMNIFPVDQILKYDSHKDFSLFTAEDISLENWLKPAEETILNEPILAVGNAHGQGIIIREGLLTSKTPESVNGEWKWLRYSAAASPGNSGGPLVNTSGQVVGIVTAKSENENLNYALPLSEVGDFNSGSGLLRIDFNYFLPGVKSKDREISELSFDLPLHITELREKMCSAKDAASKKSLGELLTNNDEEIFPKDHEGQKYILQSSYTGQFPVIATEKDDSSWNLIQPESIETSNLDHSGSIRYGKIWGNTFFQLQDQKPEEVYQLINNPENLMKTILEGYQLTRTIASEQIRIKSLGDPDNTSTIEDIWGRKWISATFPIPFADMTAILFALPTPTGIVGIFAIVNYYYQFPYIQDFTQMINNMTFAYEASLNDWQTFLEHDDILPDFLRNMSFHYEVGEELNLSTERLSLQFNPNLLGISPQSLLYIVPHFIKDKNELIWDINRIYYYENEDKRSYISLDRVFPPIKNTDTETLEKWNNLHQGKYPYTGNSIISKERTYMFKNMNPQGSGNNSNELNFSWAVGLCVDSELKSDEIERRFGYLTNGFNLKAPEGESASFGFNDYSIEPLSVIEGSTIFQAISSDDLALLKKFISSKTDINRQNNEGQTPFMLAARLEKSEMVNSLLEGDADITPRDFSGNTALLLSLKYLPEEISLLLIETGENLEVTDKDGYSPLMEACRKEYDNSARLL